MRKAGDLARVIAKFEREAAELVAQTALRLRVIVENPDVAPETTWFTVQEAAFRTKRTRKVVWAAAQRVPDAAFKDSSGRCYVNLAKLHFGPPAG